MKRLITSALILCTLFAANAVEYKKSASPKRNSYVLYISAYDFGGCADKIVVNAGWEIPEGQVKAEDFAVTSLVSSAAMNNSSYGIVRSSRKVTEAYLSDASGLPAVTPTSPYVTLKLSVNPEDESASPFINSFVFNVNELYDYRIVNDSLNIGITHRTAVVSAPATVFKTSKHVYGEVDDEITMNYAQYIPEGSENKKIPLIVFFHGMGEAGKNINSVLFNIKSTALASNTIQKHFKDGAAVLMPQCSTGWMEITEKDPFGNRLWVVVDPSSPVRRLNNKINNFMGKFFAVPQESSVVTPVSYYTEAVKDLIDQFVIENPQIDKDRIYIGGCSAGGFMTVNMMIQYPDYFAAAFPVCEAFPDERISHKDIVKLASKPMWFTVSKNDPVINPERNTLPTVERIKKAGARNLHTCYFENVTDQTGQFMNEDKNGPYEYNGHDSWIYLFNDQVTEGRLNLFDWLASQRNGK